MHQEQLKSTIINWGKELGFADIGFSDTDLSNYERSYFNWIEQGFHGDMAYMERHGTKRTRPHELEPGTVTIISVRMNYLDLQSASPFQILHQPEKAYISRYALGKDYHKIMRKRLQQLAAKIADLMPQFQYRAFCDSAPVLEGPISEKAGLGFIGKNSLTIHPKAGSWFFLGELYCNLKIDPDPPFAKQGCGPCTACIQECPTNAIIEDGIVDARKCVSYLTIEHKGSIPLDLRKAMGNRIYGCDDCQLVCPWNKFGDETKEHGFKNHNSLDDVSLLNLWEWSEEEFLLKMQGSPIRRIGYEQWQRNLTVSLGNITGNPALLKIVINKLEQRLADAPDLSELLVEHINWAIVELKNRMLETSSATNLLDSDKQTDNDNIKPFHAKKYYLPKS